MTELTRNFLLHTPRKITSNVCERITTPLTMQYDFLIRLILHLYACLETERAVYFPLEPVVSVRAYIKGNILSADFSKQANLSSLKVLSNIISRITFWHSTVIYKIP